MKQSTINRIIQNFDNHKLTSIGNYMYKIQFHPGAWKDYIIRCKKDEVGKEWINWNGERVNGWEFVRPVNMEGN